MAAMSFAVPIARSALPRLASDSIITCMACMHVYVCVGGGKGVWAHNVYETRPQIDQCVKTRMHPRIA